MPLREKEGNEAKGSKPRWRTSRPTCRIERNERNYIRFSWLSLSPLFALLSILYRLETFSKSTREYTRNNLEQASRAAVHRTSDPSHCTRTIRVALSRSRINNKRRNGSDETSNDSRRRRRIRLIWQRHAMANLFSIFCSVTRVFSRGFSSTSNARGNFPRDLPFNPVI